MNGSNCRNNRRCANRATTREKTTAERMRSATVQNSHNERAGFTEDADEKSCGEV
jgi:hypothetical protein